MKTLGFVFAMLWLAGVGVMVTVAAHFIMKFW